MNEKSTKRKNKNKNINLERIKVENNCENKERESKF